jgi:hypothetical protein
MSVRRMSALPHRFRADSAGNGPKNINKTEANSCAVFSEGKGQTFESCRARQQNQ